MHSRSGKERARPNARKRCFVLERARKSYKEHKRPREMRWGKSRFVCFSHLSFVLSQSFIYFDTAQRFYCVYVPLAVVDSLFPKSAWNVRVPCSMFICAHCTFVWATQTFIRMKKEKKHTKLCNKMRIWFKYTLSCTLYRFDFICVHLSDLRRWWDQMREQSNGPWMIPIAVQLQLLNFRWC